MSRENFNKSPENVGEIRTLGNTKIQEKFNEKLEVTEKIGTRENLNENPENNGEIGTLESTEIRENFNGKLEVTEKSGPEKISMKIPKTMEKSELLKAPKSKRISMGNSK